MPHDLLHVQHVSAARISHGKAVRTSVCPSRSGTLLHASSER